VLLQEPCCAVPELRPTRRVQHPSLKRTQDCKRARCRQRIGDDIVDQRNQAVRLFRVSIADAFSTGREQANALIDKLTPLAVQL